MEGKQLSIFDITEEQLNLPEGCKAVYEDFKRYDTVRNYLFNIQGVQRELEKIIQDKVKEPKFCFGIVWGLFDIENLPHDYQIKIIRENIIKQAIVSRTCRFLDSKICNLIKAPVHLTIEENTEGEEILNAIHKANKLFERMGYTGSPFILK